MSKKAMGIVAKAIAFMCVVGLLTLVFLFAYSYFGQNNTGVSLYFYQNGSMEKLDRVAKGDESTPRLALKELVNGPSSKDKKDGYFSQIPEGTKINSIDVKDGAAHVDFSKELGAYGGTQRGMGILQQIVFTLTEFPEIEKVYFYLEGKNDVPLGGEGLMIDEPYSRDDF